MIARIHTRIDAEHLAGFVDQDADAAGVTSFGIGTRAISNSKRASGIAENGKIERVFV